MYVSKRTFHQILACCPVVLNQFLVGLGWGWIAPTLIKLQGSHSVLPLTEEQASWIASINEVGRISSPFISPFIIDRFGRKYSIVLVAILFLIIWPSLIFIRDVYLLGATRVIFGVTNGILDVVSSIYTTENCSSEFRGIMGGIVLTVFFLGIFVETILATYLTYEGAVVTNTVISFFVFGTIYFCVETPHFLIMKGRYYEAEKSLVWLQPGLCQNELSDQLEKIKHNIQEEKRKQKSIKKLFTSTANLRSISIVLCMFLTITATGSSAITPYASMIFTSSEIFTSDQFTILYAVANFSAVCFSPFIVERINRRILLIASFSILFMCNLFVSALFYLHGKHIDIIFYPWLVFASVALYGSIRALTLPVVYTLRGELLPISVRAIGGSMAIIVNAATGFCVAKSFLPVTEYFGMEMNFLVYALMSLWTSIFIYYFLPETRGKSLDEIQKSLESGQGVNAKTVYPATNVDTGQKHSERRIRGRWQKDYITRKTDT